MPYSHESILVTQTFRVIAFVKYTYILALISSPSLTISTLVGLCLCCHRSQQEILSSIQPGHQGRERSNKDKIDRIRLKIGASDQNLIRIVRRFLCWLLVFLRPPFVALFDEFLSASASNNSLDKSLAFALGTMGILFSKHGLEFCTFDKADPNLEEMLSLTDTTVCSSQAE